MVHVVHNHFGHAILSLPMVESNQYGPFWTGSSNQSWMFPLPNGGQTIGDHVAPFLSLAPDPTNSCMDFDAIPWTRCNLCWPKQGGEVASLYCHATSWASYAPRNLIIFYSLVRGGGGLVYVDLFCQSHLKLWSISISFGMALWPETQKEALVWRIWSQ
jgi:hypothetical protein